MIRQLLQILVVIVVAAIMLAALAFGVRRYFDHPAHPAPTVAGIERVSETDPAKTRVSPAVTRHVDGLPPGLTTLPPAQRDNWVKKHALNWAAWAGPSSVYVVTGGSSRCPRIPATVAATGSSRLTVTTVRHDFYPQDTACTLDLAITTSTVSLPSAVDQTQPLEVVIDGVDTRLPGR